MPDLLLELLSEEIPARLQRKASRDLEQRICGGLAAAGLTHGETHVVSTPRRLCLAVTGLPAMSPATREERRGPSVDAPDKAVAGFLRATGLEKNDLEIREEQRGGKKGKKGETVRTYYAVIESPGKALASIVPGVVEAAVNDFPWPKSMRWGTEEFRWVRPLRSVLCILSDAVADDDEQETATAEVVPLEIAGIRSGATTAGHRFMAPDPFEVASFEDYKSRMRAAKVVLDPDEREALIRAAAIELAQEKGWEIVDDRGLVSEISGLVEWPVALAGEIDAEFLDLPPEVLQVSMREHQKFLSARNPRTGRIEGFVTVANNMARDGGARILEGNRRVLRARLADARFFWEQDLRIARDGLKAWIEGLEKVTFFKDLGSQADRARRLAELAGEIAPVTGADPETARGAAQVAKADLLSGMVQEFPELQGTMGRLYAEAAGMDSQIVAACEEHHLPAGPSDSVPRAPVSVVLALADRLDLLTGFWKIDRKPTGSADPYGLRRAALGVIRLVLDNELRLPLLDIVGPRLQADVAESLLGFVHDRLRVHLRDRGIAGDLVDSSLDLAGRDDLVLLVRRIESLAAFLETEDGSNLLLGYRRAHNILIAEERKDGVSYELAPDPALIREEAERALFEALAAAESAIVAALEAEDFVACMTEMARLRTPLDDFFDAVMVNVDSSILRRNRLCLMNRICEVMCKVADFSRITA